ncbi:hypothetical protein ACM01_46845, partial [Streptomyces viridochromogenes]
LEGVTGGRLHPQPPQRPRPLQQRLPLGQGPHRHIRGGPHRDVGGGSLPGGKALLEARGKLRRLGVEPPAGHSFEAVAERTGRQAEAMRATASGFGDVAGLVDA